MDNSGSSAKNQTTVAFELMRSDILQGHLRPQERLRIQSLSERYDIGPTAIREALSRLVTEGLVASEDQRGFYVAPVSRAELLDLTRTRIEVEWLALHQAMERGDLNWETNVLASFYRLSKTPLPITPDLHKDWGTAHRQFHESLIAGCNSPTLLGLCRMLYDKLERYRNLSTLHTTTEKRDSIAEHSMLVEAVRSRDLVQAKELFFEHLQKTADLALLADFNESDTSTGTVQRRRKRQANALPS